MTASLIDHQRGAARTQVLVKRLRANHVPFLFSFCYASLMSEQDTDQELGRDIGYALAQSPFKVKGQRIEALRHVAAGVVRHLRMAGWRFALRPPEALHGPSLPPSAGPVADRDVAVDDPEAPDVR